MARSQAGVCPHNPVVPKDRPPSDGGPPGTPDDSGSIDVARASTRLPVSPSDSVEVQFSNARLPAVSESSSELSADRSGSVDVQFSHFQLPAVTEDGEPATPPDETKRSLAEQLGHAVVQVGDAVVDRVVRAGERAGESLTHLPVASAVFPKTHSGRVMARSVVVSFLLVFSWIAVIVAMQLRRPRSPDFRPLAQSTLIALRDGKAREVYRDASTRFQEVVLEQTFVSMVDDLNRTLGRYKEVTAVLDLETGRGPGGRTGRIDFRADYEQGPTRGSLSFRWEDRRWKVLGFSVEIPPKIAAVAGSPAMRAKRVEGPRDELRRTADEILMLSAAKDYDAIWNRAAPGFQQSISLENFRETETDRRRALGPYLRILNVTSAIQNPSQTGASLQLLIQFEKATITGSFEFTKVDGAWKLVFYKLVLPLPRVPA